MNDALTIICGDALMELRKLPDESVQCCVTSPPYWGLRDYGTAEWEGGERPIDLKYYQEMSEGELSTEEDVIRHCAAAGVEPARHCDHTISGWNDNLKPHVNRVERDGEKRQACLKCGARRIDAQLGLEPTPEAYVAKMVEVFREVRRVLRKDGTLWLNLGSSMAGSKQGRNADGSIGKISSTKQQSNAGALFEREPVYGTSGKAQSDSPHYDPTSTHLCDVCRAILLSHNSHIYRSPVGVPSTSLFESNHGNKESSHDHLPTSDSNVPADHIANANLDSLLSQDLEGEPLDAFVVSMLLESSRQSQGACFHCANCGVCLSVISSVERDARKCARRVSSKPDKGETEQTWRSRMTDMVLSSEAWRYLTTISLKSKDDCAIPWLVCLALRMDGWYSRSPIIWHKPNPMPESVTDRPTKAHEYLFLLTKSASYFYDAEAIKEKSLWAEDPRADQGHIDYNGKRNGTDGQGQRAFCSIDSSGRNKRSVWTVATAPYPEAHFATYPPDLIKPCILAGTSAKGCCAECGAPWERVVEVDRWQTRPGNEIKFDESRNDNGRNTRVESSSKTIGWQPNCDCLAEVTKRIGWQATCEQLNDEKLRPVPCTVLDPFAGSGTTGAVALELGRRAVLIELNPSYVELIEQRCDVTMGLALA